MSHIIFRPWSLLVTFGHGHRSKQYKCTQSVEKYCFRKIFGERQHFLNVDTRRYFYYPATKSHFSHMKSDNGRSVNVCPNFNVCETIPFGSCFINSKHKMSTISTGSGEHSLDILFAIP